MTKVFRCQCAGKEGRENVDDVVVNVVVVDNDDHDDHPLQFFSLSDVSFLCLSPVLQRTQNVPKPPTGDGMRTISYYYTYITHDVQNRLYRR